VPMDSPAEARMRHLLGTIDPIPASGSVALNARSPREYASKYRLLAGVFDQPGHVHFQSFTDDVMRTAFEFVDDCLAGEQRALREILDEPSRDLKVRRFESFREAAVHESERLAGLIALPAFGEQAGQGHR
jgi:hypothetical protein